jgi:drug/metabolite transporter (DMT)-like permease
MVLWGSGDYFAAKLSRKISPFATNFVFSVYGVLVPLAICAFFGFPDIALTVFAKFLLVSGLLSCGFLSMVKGFSKGATGLIAPIANAYAIVTLAVSVLFLDASFKVQQLPSISLIIIGVVVVSYHRPGRKNKHAVKSVLYGLLAMLFFGVGFSLLTKITVYTWYQNQLLLSVAAVLLSVPILFAAEKRSPLKIMRKSLTYKNGFVGGIMGSVGALGMFGALAAGGSVVLTATIASAAPLFTSYLAYKLDKEHLALRQRVGTIMVVCGVIVLNIVA